MPFSHAITAVRSPTAYAGLSEYKWLNLATGVAGDAVKSAMIAFVEKNPGRVGVGGSDGWAVVDVVGRGSSAYLRTVRDGTVTDNLKELPRF